MLARLTLYTTRAVHTIYFGDNLEVLRRHVPDGAAALIYIDPPFNTGRAQARTRIKTVRSVSGDRVGFKGQRYDTVKMGSRAYPDRFDNYLEFLEPRLREAYRALAPDGTLYFHIDYREVHYCKVLLDGIFGRDSFLNEIIWAYDYGGRPTRRWPPKPDNIGAGTGGTGEGGARQAAHRHVVAHHRAHARARAHRLSDAEAAGRPPANRAGVLAPGRPRARLFRGQRHHGRGVPRDEAALSPRGCQSRGPRGDGTSLPPRARRPLGRLRSPNGCGTARRRGPRCLTLSEAAVSIRKEASRDG